MQGMSWARSREQIISASTGLNASTAVTTGSSKMGSSASSSPPGGLAIRGTAQSAQVTTPATYSLPQTGQNIGDVTTACVLTCNVPQPRTAGVNSPISSANHA